jgi:hypothetical protein
MSYTIHTHDEYSYTDVTIFWDDTEFPMVSRHPSMDRKMAVARVRIMKYIKMSNMYYLRKDPIVKLDKDIYQMRFWK